MPWQYGMVVFRQDRHGGFFWHVYAGRHPHGATDPENSCGRESPIKIEMVHYSLTLTFVWVIFIPLAHKFEQNRNEQKSMLRRPASISFLFQHTSISVFFFPNHLCWQRLHIWWPAVSSDLAFPILNLSRNPISLPLSFSLPFSSYLLWKPTIFFSFPSLVSFSLLILPSIFFLLLFFWDLVLCIYFAFSPPFFMILLFFGFSTMFFYVFMWWGHDSLHYVLYF